MDWLLIGILFPIALLFLVIGIQLIRGKWLMFIAGYNTATPQEREQINGAALGKATGFLAIFYACLIILLMLFPTKVVICLFIFLVLVTSLGVLVYVNKSPRFKN